MERLIGELERYYEVAYLPLPAYLDFGYRKISVMVDRPSVAVQSRDGYFPLPPKTGDPVKEYEVPLLECLATTPRPREFPLRSQTFHFESKGQEVEHIVAASVPIDELQFQEVEATRQYSGHLSILAQVQTFDGEVVFQRSRDYPLEGPLSELVTFVAGNVAFIEGFRLQPGRYYVEVAAYDHLSGKSSTTRQVHVSTRPINGIGISSLLMVAGLEPLSNLESYLHSPLKHAGHKVIPRLRRTVDAVAEKELIFYCVVYPSEATDPNPELTVAVYKDGEVLFRGSPDLVDSGGGKLASLFTIPTEGLSAGNYRLQAWAQSGESVATETALFTLVRAD